MKVKSKKLKVKSTIQKSKVFFVVLPFCFCLLTFWGCSTTSSGDDAKLKSSGVLEPSSIVKFSDIPIPSGFNLLSKDSYSFESSGLRVGVLRYQGKASADQVVSFYKEQMPMYNWNLLNVIEYGNRMLNFDRENETCIITLLPKGSSVIATISLGPKSQTVKKIANPVK